MNIRELVEQQGYGAQAKLARACGVTPMAVNKWVKGARPNSKHMPALSAFFGVDIVGCATPNRLPPEVLDFLTVVANGNTDTQIVEAWAVRLNQKYGN